MTIKLQKKLISKTAQHGEQTNTAIVIHNTAGGTAKSTWNYFKSNATPQGERPGIYTHYTIDDKEAYQLLEDNWKGQHTRGDGHYAAWGSGVSGINNSNAIGIEVADGSSVDHLQAIENTIELTRFLMQAYNIPLDKVVRHGDTQDKPCPATIMKLNKWDYFKQEIKKRNDAKQAIGLDMSEHGKANMVANGAGETTPTGGASSGSGSGGMSGVLELTYHNTTTVQESLPNANTSDNWTDMHKIKGITLHMYPPYHNCAADSMTKHFKALNWDRNFHYKVDKNTKIDFDKKPVSGQTTGGNIVGSSTSDFEVKPKDPLYHGVDFGGGGSSSGSGTPSDSSNNAGTLNGNDVPSKIYNYCSSQGCSKAACCGIIANCEIESSFSTTIVNKSSGATGLFQWLGARLTKLKEKASAAGKEWTDADVQIQHMWAEFSGEETTTVNLLKSRCGGLDGYKNLTDPYKAGYEFGRCFERGGGNEARGSKAKEWYDKIDSMLSGGSSSGSDNNNSNNGTKGYTSPRMFLGSEDQTEPFGWPAPGFKTIQSYYGYRTDESGYVFHPGIDIANNKGYGVYAYHKGKVINVLYQTKYNTYIKIDHGNNVYTVYGSLSSAYVKEGDEVLGGQCIGISDNTRFNGMGHIHFELWLNDQRVDPLYYVMPGGGNKRIPDEIYGISANEYDQAMYASVFALEHNDGTGYTEDLKDVVWDNVDKGRICFALAANNKHTYIERALFNNQAPKYTLSIGAFFYDESDLPERSKEVNWPKTEKKLIEQCAKALYDEGFTSKQLWREFDLNRAPSPFLYLDKNKWVAFCEEVDKQVDWLNAKYGKVTSTYVPNNLLTDQNKNQFIETAPDGGLQQAGSGSNGGTGQSTGGTLDYHNGLWIGDSRLVGMKDNGLIDNSITTVAVGGKAAQYFLNEYTSKIESVDKSKIKYVAVLLGVNDPGQNIEPTKKLLTKLSQTFSGMPIYHCEPLPVAEGFKYSTVTTESLNADLKKFCTEISSYCPSVSNCTWKTGTTNGLLNTDGKLNKDKTIDSCHLTKEGYTTYYNNIIKIVGYITSSGSNGGTGNLQGQEVQALFTGYYPANNAMEGGFYDAQGNRLDPSKNTCAAPKSIPFGTKIMIKDTGTEKDGQIYTVTDRGGAITIKNGVYHFDLLFSSNSECNAWGKKNGKAIIGNSTDQKGFKATKDEDGKPKTAVLGSNNFSEWKQEVWKITNEQRASQGLPGLKLNSKLCEIADAKSNDMVNKNYFDHYSPTYGHPHEMVTKFGVHWEATGENIAAGQKTPSEVCTDWWNSPGHKANILTSEYDMIGIGIAKANSSNEYQGYYWTQTFIKQDTSNPGSEAQGVITEPGGTISGEATGAAEEKVEENPPIREITADPNNIGKYCYMGRTDSDGKIGGKHSDNVDENEYPEKQETIEGITVGKEMKIIGADNLQYKVEYEDKKGMVDACDVSLILNTHGVTNRNKLNKVCYIKWDDMDLYKDKDLKEKIKDDLKAQDKGIVKDLNDEQGLYKVEFKKETGWVKAYCTTFTSEFFKIDKDYTTNELPGSGSSNNTGNTNGSTNNNQGSNDNTDSDNKNDNTNTDNKDKENTSDNDKLPSGGTNENSTTNTEEKEENEYFDTIVVADGDFNEEVSIDGWEKEGELDLLWIRNPDWATVGHWPYRKKGFARIRNINNKLAGITHKFSLDETKNSELVSKEDKDKDNNDSNKKTKNKDTNTNTDTTKDSDIDKTKFYSRVMLWVKQVTQKDTVDGPSDPEKLKANNITIKILDGNKKIIQERELDLSQLSLTTWRRVGCVFSDLNLDTEYSIFIGSKKTYDLYIDDVVVEKVYIDKIDVTTGEEDTQSGITDFGVGVTSKDNGGVMIYTIGKATNPGAKQPEIKTIITQEEYDEIMVYADPILIDEYTNSFEPFDKDLPEAKDIGVLDDDRYEILTEDHNTLTGNIIKYRVVETGPGSIDHCVKPVDELSMLFKDKSCMVEPIYPDLIIPPKYVTTDNDYISKNTIPMTTLSKGIAKMNDSLNKNFKYDYSVLEKAKKVNDGKIINYDDPYPYDDKIAELEEHAPKILIDEIESRLYSCNHPGCPIAHPMAKNFAMLNDMAIKQSNNIEKRLVKLENTLSFVIRNLGRLSSRMHINCVYYGGQQTLGNGKYKCIRCLKADRLHDGDTVTIDQCLCCTRYEPIIGQVYDILDETGFNGSAIIDDMQMSYMTLNDMKKLNDVEKRNISYPFIDVNKEMKSKPKPLVDIWKARDKKEYEEKLKKTITDETKLKEKLEEIKETDYVFRMDWSEDFLDLQKPDVKPYPTEKIVAKYYDQAGDKGETGIVTEAEKSTQFGLDKKTYDLLADGEWVDTRKKDDTMEKNKYTSLDYYFENFNLNRTGYEYDNGLKVNVGLQYNGGAGGSSGSGGSGSAAGITGSECRNKIVNMALQIVNDANVKLDATYSQAARTVEYDKPQRLSGTHYGMSNPVGYDCTSFVSCCYMAAGLNSMYNKSCSGGTLVREIVDNGGEMWVCDDAGIAKAQAGDVLVDGNSTVSASQMGKFISSHHAMIYIGNSEICHASKPAAPPNSIRRQSIDYYKNKGSAFFCRPKDLIDADNAASSNSNTNTGKKETDTNNPGASNPNGAF